MIDLDRIEAIARAATQGEWAVSGRRVIAPAGDAELGNWTVANDVWWPENALHIATMSPATTLALVEALKEWRDAQQGLHRADSAELPQAIVRLTDAKVALLALIGGKPAQETNNDAG